MSLVLLSWALIALGVTVTALVRVRRVKSHPRRAARGPVLVLRPVDAPSAQELENLRAPLPPGFRHVVLSPFRPPAR